MLFNQIAEEFERSFKSEHFTNAFIASVLMQLTRNEIDNLNCKSRNFNFTAEDLKFDF